MQQEGKRDYVTWADVVDLTRYLEAGYGFRFQFRMVVRCPQGEQWLKQYWELDVCDAELRPVALSQRILGCFPTAQHKVLPGLLLSLLYTADNVLSKEKVWAEPAVAQRPRIGLPSPA